MKEIDFIPDWYRNGQEKRRSYRMQYVAVGCVFAGMVLWSFITGYSVSKANAQTERMLESMTVSAHAQGQYEQLQSSLKELQDKGAILAKLDTKVSISSILAEISFLVDENIVLRKLELNSESFGDGPVRAKMSTVTLGHRSGSVKEAIAEKPVRLKVVRAGTASDAADVARLISKLEDSPYFHHVIPGAMKNKEVSKQTVTELRISCYLANYVQKKGKPDATS